MVCGIGNRITFLLFLQIFLCFYLQCLVCRNESALLDLERSGDWIDKEWEFAPAFGVHIGSAFHLAGIETDAQLREFLSRLFQSNVARQLYAGLLNITGT